MMYDIKYWSVVDGWHFVERVDNMFDAECIAPNYECDGTVRITRSIAVSLCEGRHPIPQAVDGALFGSVIEDPTDVEGLTAEAEDILLDRVGCHGHVDLFVTGLTVALIAVINAARKLEDSVTLWHYDRESGKYFPQEVM